MGFLKLNEAVEHPEYCHIPDHTLTSIIWYRDSGRAPGHFLRAVFENNLMSAFAHADYDNKVTLDEITKFVYNQMPQQSWGSPEKVKKWIEGGFRLDNPERVIEMEERIPSKL